MWLQQEEGCPVEFSCWIRVQSGLAKHKWVTHPLPAMRVWNVRVYEEMFSEIPHLLN